MPRNSEVSREAEKAATEAFTQIISEGGVMEPALPAALTAAAPIIQHEERERIAEMLDKVIRNSLCYCDPPGSPTDQEPCGSCQTIDFTISALNLSEGKDEQS